MKKAILLCFVLLLGCCSITKANKYQSRIDSIKKVVISTTTDSTLIDCYRRIGRNYRKINKDSSYYYLQKSIDLAVKTNNKFGQADGLYNKANINMRFDEHKNALKNYLLSLQIYQSEKDSTYIGSIYNSLGLLYSIMNRNNTAIDYIFKSLKINILRKDTLDIADNYSSLGSMYSDLGNQSKAVYYFKKTLEFDIKDKNLTNIFSTYISISNAYLANKNIDSAFVYLSHAKQSIAEEISPNIRRYLLFTYCRIHLLQNNIDSCKHYLNLAKVDLKNNPNFADNLNLMYIEGKINHYMGAYKKSINLLERVLKKRDSINITYGNGPVYEVLIKSYSKLNKYEKAFKVQSAYNEYSSKADNEQSKQKLLEFEFLNEAKKIENSFLIKEEKQKAQHDQKTLRLKLYIYFTIIITILIVITLFIVYRNYKSKTKANTILLEQKNIIEKQSKQLKKHLNKLKVKEKSLKHSNATKDKFFSIIAHDLRNPFNIILGFSDLLKSEFNKLEKKEAVEIINKLYSASISTYNLLENLLSWSLLQRKIIQTNPEYLNLKNLVSDCINPILENANNKKVVINNNIEKDLNIFLDRASMQSCISNIINNAIKFCNINGSIYINSDTKLGFIKINFIDDGVGIPSHKIEKLFCIEESTSTKGTMNEKGTGLGLIICKEIVNQNGGTIHVSSKENKGSKFTLSFPIEKIKN